MDPKTKELFIAILNFIKHIIYISFTIKHHSNGSLEKEGLIWILSSRAIEVDYHHHG